MMDSESRLRQTSIGKLSNDDADGNENGKKAIGLIRDWPLENLWGGRAKYKKKIRAREN